MVVPDDVPEHVPDPAAWLLEHRDGIEGDLAAHGNQVIDLLAG